MPIVEKEFEGEEANKFCKDKNMLMRITIYEPDEAGNYAVQVEGEASKEEVDSALKVVCDKFGFSTDPDWFGKLFLGKRPKGD